MRHFMNRTYLEKACEEIDASVFSGDLLFDKEDREALIEYIRRWTDAIKEHEREILPT